MRYVFPMHSLSPSAYRAISIHSLQVRLVGKTNAWRRALLVHDVLALEEDVAEDAEANAVVGLDAAVAGAAAGLDGRVVDVLSRDPLRLAADGQGEVGQSSGARENVSTVGVAVLRARDLGVVGLDDGSGQVEEGGSGVGDAVDGRLSLRASADRVAREVELPPSLAGVHVHVGDVSGVLSAVQEAKIIGTGSVVLECDGEERLGEIVVHSVKPRLLGRRPDGVERRERKTKETVSVAVVLEGRGDRGSSLNGLRSGSHAADGDLVSIDFARCARAVTVGDLPGSAVNDL